METIYRLQQVKKVTGLSRSAIYDFVKRGRFPAQINLSERSVGWLESEVNEWLQNRIALRHAPIGKGGQHG